ncbi:hypothetical protein OPW19_17980 [Vibrio europaeus]|uniref:hypothetical protein n=1 Tax=Vibrio europaeus TaxID=300876 RepID=UPI00233F72C0|nr:hypothetical protein [Vibrio europaeus]MDC5821706.1 hypothetical protein [Vibrio europaeus]MDC5868702.1 hypothetical protein [Vibrio europaeus]
MSITNPQTDNKNKVIQVRRSILLACGLSLMIGISGCSDDSEEPTQEGTKDTSTGTTDNQDNTTNDTPNDTSKLHVKFIRPAPPANSAPHVQQQNQELSGRPFQFEVYAVNDELNLQDVTTEVTWNTISEKCNGEPCYTVDPKGRLIAGAKGKFSAQAKYNGLLSPTVHLEITRKLETCGLEGNADKTHLNANCLHIIVGDSGEALDKWFTEPPRSQVMDYMYYEYSPTVYNVGYTRSGFAGGGGSALMRNDGFELSVEDTGNFVGGDWGQYDRYCKDLAQIKFNGRDNWRRARQSE